ncbi:MAG TPA: hypothetical protein VGG92_21190 [Caulobacteraceae bacterium]
MSYRRSARHPASGVRRPASGRVKVVVEDGKVVIGGRVLQPDQDPLDLMERYFDEGEPDA